MADNKPSKSKTTESTSDKPAETKSETSAIRNTIFIFISILIIIFLIALALLINRGLNTPVKPLDTGLVNSDTTPPSSNSTDNNSDTPDNNQNTNDDSTTNNSDTNSNNQDNNSADTNTDSDTGSTLDGASTSNPPVPPTPTAASTDSANSAVLPSGHTEVGFKRSLSTQTEINSTNAWRPTEYIAGDIPSNEGKYTVQYGDTLWWIAQGHYGDAFQWTKIEGANFGQIGYLPNGEHALIFPGQIFVLP